MQLMDVLCYILLIITISTSNVEADHEHGDLSETKAEKRISKREAAIFIDNFPIEPTYKHRPKVIYRRISKQRYKSPKPKYSVPVKYRTSKPWKPSQKYRRTVKPKYSPSYKRHTTKPKYGLPKIKSYKPIYGAPKKIPFSSFYPSEPAGFGEPPIDFEYQPSKHFGEPPTDSYGEPVNAEPYVRDNFAPQSSFAEAFVNFEDLNPNFEQDNLWKNFPSDQSLDNTVAYSKKRPAFTKYEPSYDLQEDSEDIDLKRLANLYKYREYYAEQNQQPLKTRSPSYVSKKLAAKPWKSPKQTPEYEDEILVGGNYAEPPERYVPKYAIDQYPDDNFTPLKGYIDPDVAISATMSPYVNYKNSNMAFSPQNLNDAFSIVDK